MKIEAKKIKEWGDNYYYEIPGLTNTMDENQAKQDFNGKANTAAIKAHDNSTGYSYPAAKYAYEYKTTGTNAGEWYFPAFGELYTVYSNKDYMNYALSLVGKEAIPTNKHHWSSTERGSSGAWLIGFQSGMTSSSTSAYTKEWEYYVRPVLAF